MLNINPLNKFAPMYVYWMVTNEPEVVQEDVAAAD